MPSGEFLKYPHVERMGHPHIAGIDVGTCHIFPKLDGTNASVWATAAHGICTGSRTRELSEEADNAGFRRHVIDNERLLRFMAEEGYRYRLYGEWLVPHTFKAYRDDAWRRFWIFDVFDHERESMVPYEDYVGLLGTYELDWIPPLAVIENPTAEDLQKQVEANTFLVKDGAGPGEGIVVKNYAWLGQYGRQPWGKIVRNEFKEDNKKAFGVPEFDGKFQVECAIAEEFCTSALVAKERAKIVLELTDTVDVKPGEDFFLDEDEVRALEEQHRGKLIPRLLQTCYHCVVTEELWAALKKHKDPTINFKRLRQFVIAQVKRHAPDLF